MRSLHKANYYVQTALAVDKSAFVIYAFRMIFSVIGDYVLKNS
jgi:hypothetical protein